MECRTHLFRRGAMRKLSWRRTPLSEFQIANYPMACHPEMNCGLRGTPGKKIVQAELAVAAPHLREGALIGLLVRPPAKKFCPVPEAVAGKMIVTHFADQLRLQRLPFARPPR